MRGVGGIDQQTAGSARLPEEMFEQQPTSNLTPISFRRVTAARLSVEYEHQAGASLFSLTPYTRSNGMDMSYRFDLSQPRARLAYERAVEYAERAKECLAVFPPSRERDALMALPDYVLARDR